MAIDDVGTASPTARPGALNGNVPPAATVTATVDSDTDACHCPICLEPYSDQFCPFVVPQCGHSICMKCIEAKNAPTILTRCPVCRVVQNVPCKQWKKNYTLLESLQQNLATQRENDTVKKQLEQKAQETKRVEEQLAKERAEKEAARKKQEAERKALEETLRRERELTVQREAKVKADKEKVERENKKKEEERLKIEGELRKERQQAEKAAQEKLKLETAQKEKDEASKAALAEEKKKMEEALRKKDEENKVTIAELESLKRKKSSCFKCMMTDCDTEMSRDRAMVCAVCVEEVQLGFNSTDAQLAPHFLCAYCAHNNHAHRDVKLLSTWQVQGILSAVNPAFDLVLTSHGTLQENMNDIQSQLNFWTERFYDAKERPANQLTAADAIEIRDVLDAETGGLLRAVEETIAQKARLREKVQASTERLDTLLQKLAEKQKRDNDEIPAKKARME